MLEVSMDQSRSLAMVQDGGGEIQFISTCVCKSAAPGVTSTSGLQLATGVAEACVNARGLPRQLDEEKERRMCHCRSAYRDGKTNLTSSQSTLAQ